MSRPQLKGLQLERLKEVVPRVSQRVPFYKKCSLRRGYPPAISNLWTI